MNGLPVGTGRPETSRVNSALETALSNINNIYFRLSADSATINAISRVSSPL